MTSIARHTNIKHQGCGYLNLRIKMSGAGAISKLIGPKYMQIAKQWMPTASLFGASAGLALLYITEWKLVLQYVPLYNSKFKNEEE